MITMCTAPCIPACKCLGTFALLNGKSKALLGVNCPSHAGSLSKIRGGDGSFDYETLTLLLTDDQKAVALKDQSMNLEYVNDGAGNFVGPYVTPASIMKLTKAPK